MVDKERLNTAIKGSGLLKKFLCSKLGISKQSLHNKLNNKTDFKGQEALVLKNVLNLSDQEFIEIFFAEQCDNLSHSNRTPL